jgi:hypothetical protein
VKQVREVILFWVQNSVKARHIAVALLLASSATAASAAILVVRSTGPSAKNFPPGKSLSENGKITLKANDMLVVLDGRGTRTLRGPGTFAPGAPAQGATRSAPAATVASATPQRRARIGAVRGTGLKAGPARPANIWQIDVTKSSTICLADKSNVTLWRGDATKPVTLTLSRAGGTSDKIQWPAGQATVTWPGGVEIADGADYRLSWPGAATPTTVRFKTLSAKPGGLEDTATALIQNGCDAQLDLLINTVNVDESAAPSA